MAILWKHLNGRLGLAITGTSVLVLVGTTVVVASIPDSAGVIHGCYQTNIGNLRVIDSAVTTCHQGEVAISWNQMGPAGPAGPQGPAGPSLGGRALTATGPLTIPCDDSWNDTIAGLNLSVLAGQTILLSGYFTTGPIFDAGLTPPSSASGSPFYGGRFTMDGLPIDGSEFQGQGAGTMSMSHAVFPTSGMHTFSFQVDCPASVNDLFFFIRPMITINTRTFAAQDLG